jgi:regulator of PEP synthase PpsR (kinase-PPPase family)
MVTAFLTQFPADAFEVHARSFLADRQRLQAVLDEVAARPGIVLHAVVSPEHKRLIEQRCSAAGGACRDLTGDFVEFLSSVSGVTPAADPGKLHNVDRAYHRRVEAIEFAMQHDDGLGLDTLREADLVLVGVSRTSKTPTTIYLAQMGYRAANYAMAYPIEPPRELLAMPRNKVVGLYIDSDHLVEIRANRQQQWRMGQGSYSDPEHVKREIGWSRQMFARQGWRTLNVTGRAIEETAARIVDVLGLARPASEGQG